VRLEHEVKRRLRRAAETFEPSPLCLRAQMLVPCLGPATPHHLLAREAGVQIIVTADWFHEPVTLALVDLLTLAPRAPLPARF